MRNETIVRSYELADTPSLIRNYLFPELLSGSDVLAVIPEGSTDFERIMQDEVEKYRAEGGCSCGAGGYAILETEPLSYEDFESCLKEIPAAEFLYIHQARKIFKRGEPDPVFFDGMGFEQVLICNRTH